MAQPIKLLALRYLKSRRQTRFASFVSLVSVLGIGLGVAVLIIVSSVMNGFEHEVRNHILGMTAHASILRPGQPMDDWKEALSAVRKMDQVTGGAPFIRGGAMLSHRGEVHGAVIQGLDLDNESQVSTVGNYISLEEKQLLLTGKSQIIVGYQLKKKLNVEVGQKITLIAPRYSSTSGAQSPKYLTFTVAGDIKVGMHEFDAGMAIVTIKDAQEIFNLGPAITGLRVKFQDPNSAPMLARQVGSALSPPAASINWTQYHRNFFEALKSQKRIMFVILSVIVAVAAFNIIAAMIMLVKEKHRDIAILRTLGMSKSAIMLLFIVQGTLVGLLGVVAGVVAGLVGAAFSGSVVEKLERWLNIEFIKSEVYFIDYLPAIVEAKDVIGIAITAGLISVAATIYPAWRASLTNPADALRYESA